MTPGSQPLTLHYRGPLTSCNYGCTYCPFAKDWEPADVLEADRVGVERFVAWAEAWQGPELHILFTPWGEALVRKWYRDALVRLSHAGSVAVVAAQTNLSMALDWLGEADRAHLQLWTTWHPTQVPMDRFVQQSDRLAALHIDHSVGVVGLRDELTAIEALRAALPAERYVWVNAYQREDNYYSVAERDRIRAVDPWFDDNRPHVSLGKTCRAGHTHFTVDGSGDMRRCHFVEGVLGNLYRDDLARVLGPRPCPNTACRCHIGYVHLPELGLYERYGRGLMARIPEPAGNPPRPIPPRP